MVFVIRGELNDPATSEVDIWGEEFSKVFNAIEDETKDMVLIKDELYHKTWVKDDRFLTIQYKSSSHNEIK